MHHKPSALRPAQAYDAMNRQSPAKITVPKVSGIVGRERLFKLLDAHK